MGLDQSAYAAKNVEELQKEDGERTELAYWRKHPNLQGWMENLWRSKGGEGEFNCVEVELTSEDLDALEESVKGQALPETTGFFFGSNSDDYYKEQDLEFIENARFEIAQGNKVFYSSWW